MLSREQTDFLLINAFNAALRAGAEIMEIYENPDQMNVSLKADNTPLTIADARSHQIIREFLQPCRLPILSEEGRDMLYEERAGWDLFWMVDPLDGTDEFIQHNGEFTVNIALISAHRPLFGVIYIPTTGEIYFSDPDRGSFLRTGMSGLTDREWGINDIFRGAVALGRHSRDGEVVRFVTSRSHESGSIDWFLDRATSLYGMQVEEIECGSSVKFCMVASGEVDFYIRTTDTLEWDTAAGEAIALGSGLQVLTPEGAPLSYNKESLINPTFVCGFDLGRFRP